MIKKISYIIHLVILFELFQNVEILEKKFEIYIKKYNKKYESLEKKAEHFKNFKKNYNLIHPANTIQSGLLKEKDKNINNKKEKLYESEINFFGDMTDEEFNKYYLLPEKTIYSIPITSIPIKIKNKNKFVIMNKPVQSGILDNDKIPDFLKESESSAKGFFEDILIKIKNFFGFGKDNIEGVLKKEQNNNYFYDKKINKEDENIVDNSFRNSEVERKYEEKEKLKKRKREIFRNQKILRQKNEERKRQEILEEEKRKNDEYIRKKKIIQKRNAEILKKRKKEQYIFLKKKQFYDQNPFLRKISQKVDWKERGYISPVRNQQKCNACYAFATIDAIQAYYAIYKKKIINLSAQEIIDCSEKNFECYGGQPFEALNYVIKNNLAFEKDYKFIGKKGICAFHVNNDVLRREGRFLQDFNFGKDNFNNFNNDFNDLKPLNNDFNFNTNEFDSFKPSINNFTPIKNNFTPLKPLNDNFGTFKSTNDNFNKSKISKPLKFSNVINFKTNSTNSISNFEKQKNLNTNFNTFTQPSNKFQSINIYKKDPSQTFKPYNYKSLNNFDNKFTTTKKKLRNSLEKLKEMEEKLTKSLPSYSQIPKISNKNKFSFVKSYRFINNNVLDLIKAIEKGPVIVAHYVSKEFKFYKRGIYTGEGCENVKRVNHASLVVGYNLNTEVPYFLLKNAWGSEWGENGFYKIKIGPLTKSNKGICLLASTKFNLVPELY